VDDKWGAGDKEKWHDHGAIQMGGERLPLIYGENPHSRSDNQHYALMHGEPVAFDGHRILIGVQIEPQNCLKSSGLSGDEIRKGGSAKIFADGVCVFEFFFRDTQWALMRAHQLIPELHEHPSGWMLREEREKLKGRKVYYRERPAIIESLIVDQGCVIVRADGGWFPAPVYAEAGEERSEASAKCEVLDRNIWWWRKD